MQNWSEKSQKKNFCYLRNKHYIPIEWTIILPQDFLANALIEYYVTLCIEKNLIYIFSCDCASVSSKYIFSSDLLSFNIHGKRSFLFMQCDLFCTRSSYIFISTKNLKERIFSNECMENLNDENIIFIHYFLSILLAYLFVQFDQHLKSYYLLYFS